MILIVPEYYEEFVCIADKCKDSCCVGWEIDIDDDTFAYYKSVEGDFGKRLKDNIRTDGCNSFCLQDKRCPFLNKQNLCDIVLELGEESLCEICTEYPRYTMDYGNVREKCLGVSCEEVGRILFEKTEPIRFVQMEIPEEVVFEDADQLDESDGDRSVFRFDEEDIDWEADAEFIRLARDNCIRILQNRSYSIQERACMYLEYAYFVQDKFNNGNLSEITGEIDTFEVADITAKTLNSYAANDQNHDCDETSVEASNRCLQVTDLLTWKAEVLDGLELLDEEWEENRKETELYLTKEDYVSKVRGFEEFYRNRQYEYEHILVYFVFRYAMRSVYDGNFFDKAQFAVFSWLVMRDMDVARWLKMSHKYIKTDRIDIARIFSKEVEHSEENMEYMAECALYEPLFQKETLKGWANLLVF